MKLLNYLAEALGSKEIMTGIANGSNRTYWDACMAIFSVAVNDSIKIVADDYHDRKPLASIVKEDMKLPFDNVLIEYAVDMTDRDKENQKRFGIEQGQGSPKRIVLLSKTPEDTLMLFSINYRQRDQDHGFWVVERAYALVKWLGDDKPATMPDFHDKSEELNVVSGVSAHFAAIDPEFGEKEDWVQTAYADMIDEICMALHTLKKLNQPGAKITPINLGVLGARHVYNRIEVS